MVNNQVFSFVLSLIFAICSVENPASFFISCISIVAAAFAYNKV